jgi:hypothetical protein
MLNEKQLQAKNLFFQLGWSPQHTKKYRTHSLPAGKPNYV